MVFAMNQSDLSPTRTLVIRITGASFGLSSLVLGAWMMFRPEAFWELIGIAGNPFAQALYGGAIMGEGAMFALMTVWPARYFVFLQYLVFYKGFASLAGLFVLLQLPTQPLGAWLTLGGWAIAGIVSAAVYPWPKKGTDPFSEGLSPHHS